MSAEERLDSDSDFKPNLVNSVCYLVEQVCVVGAGVMWGGAEGAVCVVARTNIRCVSPVVLL
jgi:hypothetical protein